MSPPVTPCTHPDLLVVLDSLDSVTLMTTSGAGRRHPEGTSLGISSFEGPVLVSWARGHPRDHVAEWEAPWGPRQGPLKLCGLRRRDTGCCIADQASTVHGGLVPACFPVGGLWPEMAGSCGRSMGTGSQRAYIAATQHNSRSTWDLWLST